MKRNFLKKIRLVRLLAVLATVSCAYGMNGEEQPQQNGEHPLTNGNVHHEQLPEQQPRQLTWGEWFERLGKAIEVAVDAIPEK